MPSGGHSPVPLALYERLFEHTGEATLLARPDGTILRANSAACQALRIPEGRVIDLGLAGIVDGDPIPVELAARSENGVTTGLTRFRRPDGSSFPVGFTCAVIPANGSGPFSYVTFRDIGERRRDDRGLRESEAKFRVAFRTSPDSVNLNRLADGAFVEVNDGFTRLTGWTAEEVAGKTSARGGDLGRPRRPGAASRRPRAGRLRREPGGPFPQEGRDDPDGAHVGPPLQAPGGRPSSCR